MFELTERPAGSMPRRNLLGCKLEGVKVYDLNPHFENRLGQIRIDNLNASWLIFGDGFNQGLARALIKRSFDILWVSLLIVLAAPLMPSTVTWLRSRLEKLQYDLC